MESMLLPNKKFKNQNRCVHPFCIDCIVKYISVKLEDNVVEIPWLTHCYCPNWNCSALILDECGGGNAKRSQCPNCKRFFCLQCKLSWHAGFKCAEGGELMDLNDVAFGVLVERNKWKRCPNCRRFVSKTDGCKIVKCRCNANFCYECGRQVRIHLCGCGCDSPDSMIINCLGLITWLLAIYFLVNGRRVLNVGFGKSLLKRQRSLPFVTTVHADMVKSVMERGELSCDQSEVLISYLMNGREKIHPTFIRNNRHVELYMLCVDSNNSRPILRVKVFERSREEASTSAPPPPSSPPLPPNMDDTSTEYDFMGCDEWDNSEDYEEEKCGGDVIAKNIVRGTSKHGYAVLPVFSYIFNGLNLGPINSLRFYEESGRFIYYFMAFGASICGYAHMRKVAAVDGMHLFGKYKGVLLFAVAQDTQNHIYPLAYCVVDKENDESWGFFFEKLKAFVVDEPKLCIISDRHVSIANGLARHYPLARHGVCIRHLGKNLRINHHCSDSLYLYYHAAKAYTLEEFNDYFNALKKRCPSAAACLEHEVGFEK
ncbi:putative BURP domain-containing protein 17-like [Capsicum annuum]|nr:putative BURP domain-containing protein 17-like [Capsicum annuum]